MIMTRSVCQEELREIKKKEKEREGENERGREEWIISLL